MTQENKWREAVREFIYKWKTVPPNNDPMTRAYCNGVNNAIYSLENSIKLHGLSLEEAECKHEFPNGSVRIIGGEHAWVCSKCGDVKQGYFITREQAEQVVEVLKANIKEIEGDSGMVRDDISRDCLSIFLGDKYGK